ncbi:hypothetical protein SAMN05660976_08417 [Nonomuraea pusilla]|uniref:Uncharacterized protein n=1 Tax=Nonomuraea pusilla TaxID=46177 RepID=A0A1H8JQV7_9ACTN|nr:hypothetical protein SAMN05660976_08417 [Nonomuraea pusilla]
MVLVHFPFLQLGRMVSVVLWAALADLNRQEVTGRAAPGRQRGPRWLCGR